MPSPALFHVDESGLQWRNPELNKVPPQYVDILRNLMQKKLAKLGQHYYQMFILPEQQKQSLTSSTMLTGGIPVGVASCIPNNNKTNSSMIVDTTSDNNSPVNNDPETSRENISSVVVIDDDAA